MTWPQSQSCSARPAFALIIVMWVVLIAGLMLIGAQRAIRVNFATAHSELASVQAHWLARAGLEQALTILQDDEAVGADHHCLVNRSDQAPHG